MVRQVITSTLKLDEINDKFHWKYYIYGAMLSPHTNFTTSFENAEKCRLTIILVIISPKLDKIIIFFCSNMDLLRFENFSSVRMIENEAEKNIAKLHVILWLFQLHMSHFAKVRCAQ